MPAASTPPFLLWAIGYKCPIRGFENGSDPERTERQLRAAIATSDARRDGRVFEGYAIDEPLGFRVDEALALYGGLTSVQDACEKCPANAAATHQPAALAGCVGICPLPSDERDLWYRAEQAIEKLGLSHECSRLFPATQPRWFGFWMPAPLTTDQTGFLAEVIRTGMTDYDLGDSFRLLLAGLCTARDQNLPLHAALYPRGTIERNWWRLTTHCPRCKADWKSVGRGHCETCGYDGHPAPDKKRRARGRRPYLPLERLMGQHTADFLARYRSTIQ